MSTISRYRNGLYVPNPESDLFRRLAQGLAAIARDKGREDIDADSVAASLRSAIYEIDDDYDLSRFDQRLDALTRGLGVNMSDLGEYVNYDVSSLYRIRSGARRPGDPVWLARSTARYVSERYAGLADQKAAAELLGSEEPFHSAEDYYKSLCAWLLGSESPHTDAIREMFAGDDFDPRDYSRTFVWNESELAAAPLRLPVSKVYTGEGGAEAGVLDFLQTSIETSHDRGIVMYSDLPLFPDKEFRRKMSGCIAALLKRGCRITVIHAMDRPDEELASELEIWLPLYMSGRVTPYFLSESRKKAFRHLLMVSGNAALYGDAIDGHWNQGRFTLTRTKKEITGFWERAESLLECARPLMEIYNVGRKAEFNRLIRRSVRRSGDCRMYLSAPPVCTIREELLRQILNNNGISENAERRIREYIAREKGFLDELLRNREVRLIIAQGSGSDFNTRPAALSLSGLFWEGDVLYSYAEFREHLEELKSLADEQENLSVDVGETSVFRGMQIQIQGERYAVISRNRSSAVHFVVRQKRFIRTLEMLLAGPETPGRDT